MGFALQADNEGGEWMKGNDFHYVYGPVLSRRLGRSLGIDLVPFKTCTYDCIYCQLGRTTHKTLERKECINGDEIIREVERKISAAPACDVVTLSGSGEPTLNNRIGDIITEIKKLTTVPIAVLTNGSLLWMEDVRESLMNADIVIPSLDAGDEHLFQHVNRPHRELSFRKVVEGLIHFTKTFSGSVWLEVFLLAGITGIQSEVEKIAVIAHRINPAKIHLNTVTRPPAEEFACPVAGEKMQFFKNAFRIHTSVISEEGIDITAHPAGWMTESEILSLLRRRPSTLRDVSVSLGIPPSEATEYLERLVREGRAKHTVLNGQHFYFSSKQ